MGKIHWTKKLSNHQKGLAVEGMTDKLILEAFLDVLDPKWTEKLTIEVAGSKTLVTEEMTHPRVYGLIDRDLLTDGDIRELTGEHPRLYILPRIVIENYCIDPDEIETLLPAAHRKSAILVPLRAELEAHIDEWKNNRAIDQVMYERGAHSFCEGQDGFPRLITNRAVQSRTTLENVLSEWYERLKPDEILGDYDQRLTDFAAQPQNKYKLQMHGKRFFEAVVVLALQGVFPNQRVQNNNPSSTWLRILFDKTQRDRTCPDDLEEILEELLS